MNREIGRIDKRVIELLDLKYEEDTPIYIGDANIIHMQTEHKEDYEKYGQDIEEIIKSPTYVALNPNKGSIEYIKEYIVNEEVVILAVRVTNNNRMFARTLFKMSEKKKDIYFSKGYAKRY